jgi:hypothetical protein
MKIRYIGPKQFKRVVGEEFDQRTFNEMRTVFDNFSAIYTSVEMKFFKTECRALIDKYYAYFDADRCVVLFGSVSFTNNPNRVGVVLISDMDVLEMYKKFLNIEAFV